MPGFHDLGLLMLQASRSMFVFDSVNLKSKIYCEWPPGMPGFHVWGLLVYQASLDMLVLNMCTTTCPPLQPLHHQILNPIKTATSTTTSSSTPRTSTYNDTNPPILLTPKTFTGFTVWIDTRFFYIADYGRQQ